MVAKTIFLHSLSNASSFLNRDSKDDNWTLFREDRDEEAFLALLLLGKAMDSLGNDENGSEVNLRINKRLSFGR